MTAIDKHVRIRKEDLINIGANHFYMKIMEILKLELTYQNWSVKIMKEIKVSMDIHYDNLMTITQRDAKILETH